jgi:hypothetical protein
MTTTASGPRTIAIDSKSPLVWTAAALAAVILVALAVVSLHRTSVPSLPTPIRPAAASGSVASGHVGQHSGAASLAHQYGARGPVDGTGTGTTAGSALPVAHPMTSTNPVRHYFGARGDQ